MAFTNGNEFWKLKSKFGRDKIFETPEILEAECNEYIIQTSQLTLDEQSWHGKDGDEKTKHHPVPLTLTGLWVFLNISKSVWYDYKARPAFLEVITRVEAIFFTQKFNYASTGHFNANIIARDLGLIDKQDHNVKLTKKKIGFGKKEE